MSYLINLNRLVPDFGDSVLNILNIPRVNIWGHHVQTLVRKYHGMHPGQPHGHNARFPNQKADSGEANQEICSVCSGQLDHRSGRGMTYDDAVEFCCLSSVHFMDSLREIPELHTSEHLVGTRTFKTLQKSAPVHRRKQNSTAERTAGQPQRPNQDQLSTCIYMAIPKNGGMTITQMQCFDMF